MTFTTTELKATNFTTLPAGQTGAESMALLIRRIESLENVIMGALTSPDNPSLVSELRRVLTAGNLAATEQAD